MAMIGVLFFAIPAQAHPPAERPAPTAADKETARIQMDTGHRRLAEGDRAGALAAFRAAHELMGVPTTGLATGKLLAEGGELVEARDVLLEVAGYPRSPNEPALFAKAIAEAEALALELKQRIGSIEIVLKSDNKPLSAATPVEVKLHGEPLGRNGYRGDTPHPGLALRRVNPGSHHIEVSAHGYRRASTIVKVNAGEHQLVELELTRCTPDDTNCPGFRRAQEPPDEETPPASPPPPRPLPPPSSRPSVLTHIGFSVALAGFAVALPSGAVALSNATKLAKLCPDHRCPPDQKDFHASAVALGHVSTVTLAIGLAGAALGVVGLVMRPRAERPRQAMRQAMAQALAWQW